MLSKPASFRLVPVLLVTALVAIGVIGGVFYFFKVKGTSSITQTKNNDIVSVIPLTQRARRGVLTPDKAARLQVYTEDKVVAIVEIEKGSVSKNTPITVIPNKIGSDGQYAGITIEPATLRLKKPASITIDLSRSSHRFAGRSQTSVLSTSYVSPARAIRVEGKDSSTAFVAHPLVTSTQATLRFISGGSYVLTSATEQSTLLAQSTLRKLTGGSLSLMEAALEVIAEKKTVAADQKTKLVDLTTKLIDSRANVSAFELAHASILSQQLNKAQSFIPQAFAQGNNLQGYLEFQCKSQHSVQEYVMYAQNAQLLGFDDIGEGCMTAAKNLVAEEARKVLAKSPPSLPELVQMLAKVQMFGIEQMDTALQNKIAEVAKKNAEDILNDPNATPEEIIKRLQELQATTNEGELGNKLEAKARDAIASEVSKTLSDPHATMTEVAIAMQKAQAFGLEAQSTQAANQLKSMANRSYQEILDNPRSTSQELQNAWADAYEKGVDKQTLDDIKKKWKDAEKEESKPTPTPSPRKGDSEENLEFVGIDENLFGLALAHAFGLNSFDEKGLKAFADEKKKQGEEMNEATLQLCQLLDSPEFQEMKAMGADIPGMEEMYQNANTGCSTEIESGKAMRDLDKAVDDVYNYAEEVGDTQSQEYEQEDQSPHMEIEITPTPEPEENNTSDIGQQESEFQSEEHQNDQLNDPDSSQ